MGKLVSLIVTWGPTVLLGLALLVGFLIGFIRGLRRSRISLIHTLIAGGLAVSLFVLLTNLQFFDTLFYNLFGEMLKDILNVYEFSDIQNVAGDTSGDGKINALDLLQIQKDILDVYEIKQ